MGHTLFEKIWDRHVVDTLLRSEGSEYELLLKGGARLRVGRSRREELERRLGRTW